MLDCWYQVNSNAIDCYCLVANTTSSTCTVGPTFECNSWALQNQLKNVTLNHIWQIEFIIGFLCYTSSSREQICNSSGSRLIDVRIGSNFSKGEPFSFTLIDYTPSQILGIGARSLWLTTGWNSSHFEIGSNRTHPHYNTLGLAMQPWVMNIIIDGTRNSPRFTINGSLFTKGKKCASSCNLHTQSNAL